MVMENKSYSNSALEIVRDCEGYGDSLDTVPPWKQPKCKESKALFMRIAFSSFTELSSESQIIIKKEKTTCVKVSMEAEKIFPG